MKKSYALGLLLAFMPMSGNTAFAQKTEKKSKTITSFVFKGKVVDAKGRGIRGVVVNDGYTFTTTAANGSWSILCDTMRSKFVAISVPAAYSLPQVDGLATGYYASVKTLASKKSHNFRLVKRAYVPTDFRYIAISDPQINNAHDMNRWKKETVVDLKKTIAETTGRREVVATTLGDLVWDQMNLFAEYRQTCMNLGATIFQCIGNHDFDKRFKALSNIAKDSTNYAEQVYSHYFGPTDYSYNIGKVHIITLKNIDYTGNKRYTEQLTKEQLNWLRKDLSYVAKGTTVFINMHAAGWNKLDISGNLRNAAQLELLLRGYKVHIFSGHTHYYQNIIVNDELYQHNIGAACGAWWTSDVNRCGAPNGYLVVDVSGNDVQWHYKSTGEALSKQMRLYAKGSFSTQKDYVVANIWDWDDDCSVVWYQDDKYMGRMEQFIDVDETFGKTQKKRTGAATTFHLFRAVPNGGKHTIKVVFTNRFGDAYTETISEK